MNILNIKQRERVAAEYAAGGISMRQLATKYGVAASTVQAIVSAQNKEVVQRRTQIKKQAEKEADEVIRDFIAGNTERLAQVAEKSIGLLLERVSEASVRDIAGVLKITMDAMQAMKEQSSKAASAIDDKKALETYVAELKRYSEHE